ncbi:Bug family tripartite tricarboxylate transporter substrate binding protein [Malikia spinosa]|uniref:Tripartite tricarboxylate transporter substrate binding protein n=1 Tax=Malikia spinosa TaxID=86180 RepID=A0A2S9KJ10_9BURK|nr:tripartite tricarboxylate transporter substrate binding protein [Malikia spinosa]MYZ53137.1 tripartite tricarboxylate transporter substrate binding protein [Malikia spinosa]PRD70438.1 tripartite tricarboxylate transporter substrate binding protein [Malikia spinosa]
MKRPTFRLLTLCLSACCAWTPAMAQDSFPSKTIKIVNNFAAGGPSDVLARSIGQVLAEKFKQAVIVENKPGAAGNLGADAVVKSPADGHTLLFSIDTTFTVNPHIYGKTMPFKASELRPVVIISSSGLMVAVNPATGIKTLKDFIAVGKAKGLTLSSAGNGAPGHLAAERLTDAAQIKITHIPYKGNSPAVTAVLANEVDGGVLATSGLLPFVRSGKITGLAVTSSKRSRLAPELPTVAELGMKELEQDILYLALVPSATPEAVVQKLQTGILEALKRPEFESRLANLDMALEGQTGAEASKRLAETSERYGKLVRATGMKVE